ncbi:MAG: hypothetical protein H7174_05705 [Flavobacterium sp.]|nr:hypothetical protein [Flavobacterium sp.]
MKTQFLGLKAIVENVSDIEKAKSWYEVVFSSKPYFEKGLYLGFNTDGYTKIHFEPFVVGKKIIMVCAFDTCNNILGIIYNPYFRIN